MDVETAVQGAAGAIFYTNAQLGPMVIQVEAQTKVNAAAVTRSVDAVVAGLNT